ncbi:MAG: AraC family transcriptional regulator [Bacteroidetes bacterium]|nr:MAG: AraC family transcriptional regulator [Bacteroidota bacterium]
MKNIVFKNIGEFHRAQNLPEPENPLFSIVHHKLDADELENCAPSPEEIAYTNNFYFISLKNIVSGELLYGRTKYDCSTGTMLFTAPGQTIVAKNIVISSESWMIAFHEDFIRGLEIRTRIKSYNFFNYHVNEALHLSPKEDQIVKSIFQNIEAEYHNNQDEFSKDLIISHLDTLLKYADRFYKRQFLNRKEINKQLLTRFTDALNEYFENQQQIERGLPTVDWLASQLGVSHRYLSDTLKAETGKTAIENLHLYLIDEAKNLLLEPYKSVSEVAYELGFEYPQYFSRLFKKKEGMSPLEYREKFKMN